MNNVFWREKREYLLILFVGLFWDKMNSEIFSYLEFHTVDEEKRAQVGAFFMSFNPVAFTEFSTYQCCFQALKDQEEKDEEDMAEKIKASFKKSAAEKNSGVTT